MEGGDGVGQATGRGTLVVADSSTLIALEQIGLLGILHSLFADIVVPPAVHSELRSIPALPEWIRVESPNQGVLASSLRGSLGPGEWEAIALALELNATRLATDDRDARKAAKKLSIEIVGTLGLLEAAKRNGVIAAIKPHLDALLPLRFRLSRDLYEKTLRENDEEP